MITTEIYKPDRLAWESIKSEVVALEREAFGEKSFKDDEISVDFLNPKTTTALLKKGEHIIGFTYARSLDDAKELGRESEITETVYIWNTVISKEYRGRHLVGILMSTLENELKRKGYSYIERAAMVTHEYAAHITKHYADRILKSEPVDTKYGKQVFFRIKL